MILFAPNTVLGVEANQPLALGVSLDLPESGLTLPTMRKLPENVHSFSLGGSLSPQFQQYLASGGLSDRQLLFVHRTESEPSVP